MTTFDTIILILFVIALAFQFVASVEKKCFSLMFLFAFEIAAFAYLSPSIL